MANKIIKHCYDMPPYNSDPKSVDKSKSISELSNEELRDMLGRLRSERELESLIRDLKRSSGEKYDHENPWLIDTKTPIDQLYHHGILGQKWGRRRFQNEDGTRTQAGKKRDRENNRDTEYKKSDDHINSRKSKNMAPDGLTNEELKKLNERLQLEETYKKLTKEQIQKGESFVARAIKSGAEGALSEFSKSIFLGSAKLLVKGISPQFAEATFKIKDTDKSKK